MEIYTREWLNAQFRVSWEANNGPAQTRYFMEALLANLPVEYHDFIGRRSLRLLDWGCAMGDGVDVLAKTFPNSEVNGIDISDEAIRRAAERFPRQTFIRSDAILQPYDVIFTSNCLEHFHEPIPLLAQHLAMTRLLYIALVPHDEDPLMFGHFTRFTADTFPETLSGFRRWGALSFPTPPQYWAGSQLLIVYGSPVFALPPIERRSFFHKGS